MPAMVMKLHYRGGVLPLFLVGESGRLRGVSGDAKPSPQPGDVMLSLVLPLEGEGRP